MYRIASDISRVEKSLTEKQHKAVWMYCVEKESQSVIAEEPGVTQQRVCSLIKDGLKKMLKKLGCYD